MAPMMAIETVAAGGGSVCRFDGVKLMVGPESAAADPGPACYGRGGPLAVTDMNLYQGKILAEHFPFPARSPRRRRPVAGTLPRDRPGHRPALHGRMNWPMAFSASPTPRWFRRFARSRSPREPIPASTCSLPLAGRPASTPVPWPANWAIRQVLCSPDAGMLSAYGIGMADVVRHRVAGVYQPYSEAALADLEAAFQRLAGEACDEVVQEGFARHQVEVHRLLDLRYRGFDSYLTIPDFFSPAPTGDV